MGLLTVKGKLDLNQFWPVGNSDADTTEVILTVTGGAFRYSATGTGAGKVLHLFDDAVVRGKGGSTPVIKKGQIKVRLQGIDAPELHYRPLMPKGEKTQHQREAFLKVNEEYRQCLAETGTVELADKLATFGKVPIPCLVTTAVESPNQAFDTYGRLVGDLLVGSAAKRVNVNQWLLSNGLAYPAFYNSMTVAEITRLLQALPKDRANQVLWKRLRKRVGTLNTKQLYRRPSTEPEFDAAKDVGPVLMPKLFRRQVSHYALKFAQFTTHDFKAWLDKQSGDKYFLLEDYLADPNTAAEHDIGELLAVSGADFRLTKAPDQIVFKEARSTLVDGNGDPITEWS